MHPIDIFSDSPKFFIFQKETNKTNFGGALTLIFSLIMITISFLCLLDYIDLNDYSIEYSHILNSTFLDDIPKLNNNPDLNPNFTFFLDIINDKDESLSERFILYDLSEKKILDRKNDYIVFNKRISDFHLGIVYNCSNENNDINKTNETNCILKEEDISEYGYKLIIIFNISKTDLQNYPTPIIKDEYITKFIHIPFYFIKYTYIYDYNWEVIKYIKQNTLLDRFSKEKKEYFSGQISETSTSIKVHERKDNFKELMFVRFNNYHNSYIEYKRKRKTLLDLVSKILPSFQFLRFCFLFVFKYYSKNFNNYKIIENVLANNNKIFREIELNNTIYEPTYNYNNNSVNNKNNNLNYPLINNTNNKNNLNINDNDGDSDNNNAIDYLLKQKILPKLTFMHFFCNNLYFNKCSQFRSQEILHICNKIVLKYMSIDSIIYNQMKLENLFKDYKWNNPELNNIENNKMISNLKSFN